VDRGVTIVDYEHAWPVGSTAAPGLAAKPIIDLDAVVRPPDLPAAIARLSAAGYVHEGDLGVPGREAFVPPPGGPAHHLYLCGQDSVELRRQLFFRDYLRSHPEAVAEYATLKRALAARCGHDRLAYTEGKSAFVEGILRRA